MNDNSINYLKKIEQLQEKKTKEEIDKLLINYKNLTDQQKENVFLYHSKLITYTINKYFPITPTYCTYDDLFMIGCIGLEKSFQNFNINKKIQFSSFAIICIRNQILMYLRKMKKTTTEISMEEKINSDCNITIHDTIKMENDNLFDQITIETTMNEVKKLNKEEFFILVHSFGINGYEKISEIEMGKILNLSQPHINRKKHKILKKLKSRLDIDL